MKASALWLIGIMTIGIPFVIVDYLENGQEKNYFKMKLTDFIAWMIAIPVYYIGTRLIDKKYSLIRKQQNKPEVEHE